MESAATLKVPQNIEMIQIYHLAIGVVHWSNGGVKKEVTYRVMYSWLSELEQAAL